VHICLIRFSVYISTDPTQE